MAKSILKRVVLSESLGKVTQESRHKVGSPQELTTEPQRSSVAVRAPRRVDAPDKPAHDEETPARDDKDTGERLFKHRRATIETDPPPPCY
jgi:hypothetical protein